jgi:3-hydroxyisobutyrate dehydrogenase-like beta-hydroxyacid dehydrogenase
MPARIGILHPGEMGISLAASAQNSGGDVFWCEAGRSPASHKRALGIGLQPLSSLQELCDTCEVLISVCPPHGAAQLAADVLACNYRGIYADVNAIAPDTVKSIAASMSHDGISFIDGGIIGAPATKPGTTWLYLSGVEAEKVAACFSKGPLETSVLGDEIGQASGLKMCFAANSKGTAALHTAILGAAEAMGVRQALEKQWEIYTPGFTEKSQNRIKQVARKAWRFSGEMREIAATLEASGMPPAFFLAAAELYQRQAAFKDAVEEPGIEEVLEMVARKTG